MKKTILIICLFSIIKSYAQPNTYSKVFYDANMSGIEARSMVRTPDKGYMIAGQSDFAFGYLQRLDSSGNFLWNKKFSNNALLQFNSIANTYDTSFVIAGNNQTGGLPGEAFCGKFNSTGDTVWMKTIAFAGWNAKPTAVLSTIDSGFIITGTAESSSQLYKAMLVIKINKYGSLEWSNLYGSATNQNSGYSIKQGVDSNYYLIGYLQGGPPTYQEAMTLVQLSQSGSVLWAKAYTLPVSQIVRGNDLVLTNDGMVLNFSTDQFNALMKTDLAGNVLWSNGYSYAQSSISDFFYSKVKLTSDSGFISLSTSNYTSLTKTDAAGNMQWIDDLLFIPADVMEIENQHIFVSGNGPLMGVKGTQVLVPQIGIIVTDSTGYSPNCVFQNFITQTPLTVNSANLTVNATSIGTISNLQTTSSSSTLVDYLGCVDATGGIEENEMIKLSIAPNPAHGVFEITKRDYTNCRLTIYNMIGNTMYTSTLNNEITIVDFSDYPKGIYYCSVINRFNNNSTGRKIVIE